MNSPSVLTVESCISFAEDKSLWYSYYSESVSPPRALFIHYLSTSSPYAEQGADTYM